MRRSSLITLFFIVCFVETSFTPKFTPIYGVKVIVIDAGHGGKDPGCHGSKHNEKDIALSVALKLGSYIKDNLKDVKVVYTRKTDVFVELQKRAEIANKANADLFISIHCNAACYRDKRTRKDVCKNTVQGTETYVLAVKNEAGNLNVANRENEAILLEDDYVEKVKNFDPNSDEAYIIQSMFNAKFLDQSLKFASNVQHQYKNRIGRKDKGVKRASLWVLWRTYMPSVLTEIGYLTNKEEERFLASEKGQEYIASGLFRAFRDYKNELEGAPNTFTDAIEKQGKYTEDISVKVDTVDREVKDTTIVKVVKTTAADTIKIPVADLHSKVYKVQLISSENRLLLNSELFKNVEKPGEYQENGVYKYTSGHCANIKEANLLKQKLRKSGFSDAFVIAMKDGKRVPIK